MNNASLKLSPSDLTFLWDECPRCFYLKVALGINRPQLPFPKIFSRIDQLMKDFFAGKSTVELFSSLPVGVVKFGEKWVTSELIRLPGHARHCYLTGKFDTLVAFEDGSYGVVDFKTSEAKPENIPFYGRQLHAYAYALEHPAPGKLALSPISKLGLLVVEPSSLEITPTGKIAYTGEVTWQDITKDETQFLHFIDKVLDLLELPEPPDNHPKCGWCQYRQIARDTGM